MKQDACYGSIAVKETHLGDEFQLRGTRSQIQLKFNHILLSYLDLIHMTHFLLNFICLLLVYFLFVYSSIVQSIVWIVSLCFIVSSDHSLWASLNRLSLQANADPKGMSCWCSSSLQSKTLAGHSWDWCKLRQLTYPQMAYPAKLWRLEWCRGEVKVETETLAYQWPDPHERLS